jgi:hypothetical protein
MWKGGHVHGGWRMAERGHGTCKHCMRACVPACAWLASPAQTPPHHHTHTRTHTTPVAQANRDSARRSKQKKKQEVADLSTRKDQLNDTNQDLVDKVNEALERVRQLQGKNSGLRTQYHSLLHAGAG